MTATLTHVTNPGLSSAWDLRSIAGTVLNKLRPAAAQQENALANDIPADIYLNADRQLLASVLRRLLSAVVQHSKGSYIRLTAKVYSDVILLHIKDHNIISSISIDSSLQCMAGKMGGFVEVSSRRDAVTTVSFSFPNLPLAA